MKSIIIQVFSSVFLIQCNFLYFFKGTVGVGIEGASTSSSSVKITLCPAPVRKMYFFVSRFFT